jgi:hypothetical protein
MSRAPAQRPLVTRFYRSNSDHCARAIELLLKSPPEKKGTRPGAPDDRKGPEHDPAKVSISPQ